MLIDKSHQIKDLERYSKKLLESIKAEQAYKKKWDTKKPNGFIYILHCSNSNYYKIGRSKKNPISRIASIQSACPFELLILAAVYVKNYELLEKRTHRQLKDKHVRGEWFEVGKSEIDNILDLVNAEAIYK